MFIQILTAGEHFQNQLQLLGHTKTPFIDGRRKHRLQLMWIHSQPSCNFDAHPTHKREIMAWGQAISKSIQTTHHELNLNLTFGLFPDLFSLQGSTGCSGLATLGRGRSLGSGHSWWLRVDRRRRSGCRGRQRWCGNWWAIYCKLQSI